MSRFASIFRCFSYRLRQGVYPGFPRARLGQPAGIRLAIVLLIPLCFFLGSQLPNHPSSLLAAGHDDEQSQPVSDQQVETLIKKLSSRQFSERQQASTELWQLGPERTAHRLAMLAREGDLESRKRAEAILHRYRIGLVPTLDRFLAQQILNFEQGSNSQKAACVERLLRGGHVATAMALVRSVKSETSESWFENIFYSPDHFAVDWLKQGNLPALRQFFADPDIVEKHNYFAAHFAVATGQSEKLLEDLERIVSPSAGDEDADLSLQQLLGSPEVSPGDARLLRACLLHFQDGYTQSLQELEDLPNRLGEQFRLAMSYRDYPRAAELVGKLNDQRNRRFVLPEEDIARELSQALLRGWGGDRQAMRQQLQKIPSATEQSYSLACALGASGELQLLDYLMQSPAMTEKSAQFELYSDMEMWDRAFQIIEFPLDGKTVDQLKWVQQRVAEIRKEEDTYRQGLLRSTLLEVSETLDSLGRTDACVAILAGLATVRTAEEGEPDYSQVQLCRRAVSMGQFDWAAKNFLDHWRQVGDTSALTIWFPGNPQADFWFRQLPEWDPSLNFRETSDPGEALLRLNRLIALIGRLTRTSGVQTIEADRFMDLGEAKHWASQALELARQARFNQIQAYQAAIRLLWDYQQYADLSELQHDPNLPKLDGAFQNWVALGVWMTGQPEQARKLLWQSYWRTPENLAALVLCTLPIQDDPFQITPPVAGADWSELRLLQHVRPWTISAQEIAETNQWYREFLQQHQTSGEHQSTQLWETSDLPWVTVEDQDLMRLARLHYCLRPLDSAAILGAGDTFRDMGADRLAAWQTLEFKQQAIWQEAEQQSVYAANFMLSHVPDAGPHLAKAWRCETIAKSLLNYPIGTIGLYLNFGLSIRSCDVKIALHENREQDALAIIQEITGWHPYDIDIVEHFTAYYDRQNNQAAAEQFFQKSFQQLQQLQERFPKSALLANNLAWMCVQGNRRLSEAENLVRLAIQLEPGTSNYPDTLADILWKQGRLEQAMEMNQRSRDLAPTRAYYRRQTFKLLQPPPRR